MTFVIVMGFHQIIVVMNNVKRHTYIHTYIAPEYLHNSFVARTKFDRTYFLHSYLQYQELYGENKWM